MDFKSWFAPYQKEALEKLQAWIRIPSVYDEESVTEQCPFGKNVDQALSFIASLALEKGFSVDRCDGYCTEITYGKGEKIIGIYAHCDVVPVSGEWKHPPFAAEIEDEVLYGRGTSDDKGPAMAAFYALVALKEHHLIDDTYQVRLVIGGNEERGSACLDYYFHHLHKPYPTYGFTPDGEFPLIYGEKGIANYETKGMIQLSHIIDIHAGVVANSVIDFAKATLKDVDIKLLRDYLEEKKYQYQIEENEHVQLTIKGKAAHGSLPEGGVNAGLQLLDALSHVYDIEEWKAIVEAYRDPSGKTLGEFYHSDLLHDTTYNVGIIEYQNQVFSMVVNFRYPEQVVPQEVIKRIDGKLPFQTTLISASSALCIDPQSPMIQNLLRVYQEETGDYKTPIMTIGGGTYAKESKNTIAFGSAFPGNHDCIHDANEHIELKDFYLSMPIYAHAIYTLGKETCE